MSVIPSTVIPKDELESLLQDRLKLQVLVEILQLHEEGYIIFRKLKAELDELEKQRNEETS